jgi:hypothetical protein
VTGDGYTGRSTTHRIRTLGGSEIVHQYAGERTGDTIYKTADGRRWRQFDGTPRTGDVVARIFTEIR